jgi:hypothetical protein
MSLNRDLQALRDYVTGPTSQNQADSTVRLLVTHSNLNAKFMDIVFDLHVSWLYVTPRTAWLHDSGHLILLIDPSGAQSLCTTLDFFSHSPFIPTNPFISFRTAADDC